MYVDSKVIFDLKIKIVIKPSLLCWGIYEILCNTTSNQIQFNFLFHEIFRDLIPYDKR